LGVSKLTVHPSYTGKPAPILVSYDIAGFPYFSIKWNGGQ
jgi:hypothetical protein